MSNIRKLVESIARYANDISEVRSSELLYGTIVTLEPLSVKISTFKEPITEEFLVLGQMCRPHTVTIPHKHEYNGITEETNDGGQGAQNHAHEIKQQVTEDLHLGTGGYEQESVVLEIYPKLAVGDTVLLFSFNNGQKYYIAERILKNASTV
jgi:hypothetical protein